QRFSLTDRVCRQMLDLRQHRTRFGQGEDPASAWRRHPMIIIGLRGPGFAGWPIPGVDRRLRQVDSRRHHQKKAPLLLFKSALRRDPGPPPRDRLRSQERFPRSLLRALLVSALVCTPSWLAAQTLPSGPIRGMDGQLLVSGEVVATIG